MLALVKARNKQCAQSWLNTVTGGLWRITEGDKASGLGEGLKNRAEKFGGAQLPHRMPLHHPAPGGL